jgi:Ice-binding-like
MSKLLCLARARRAGILLTSGLACAAFPAVASASAVNLGTAKPFVVLAASAATNTGPSVLNGDLGVYAGTSLSGFGSPAVVNGATHDADAVAGQAQKDLSTAYGVAAGQPIKLGNDLTGKNVGNRTLQAGAYSFSSSAQLTGRLTLDAGGNPNAQFVFEIGSTLTTASASSVRLINGASPCNVYWQVGSSATLGTTTSFIGNVLAHDSISLDDSATVQGRLLALGGAVTLIHNKIDGSMCGTSTTPPPGSTPPGTTPPTTGTTPPTKGSTPPTKGSTPPKKGSTPPARVGAKPPRTSHPGVPTRRGWAKLPHPAPPSSLTRCSFGFTATVRGREIKRVVFMLDGKRLASRNGPRFSVHVPAAFAGSGHLMARVTFKDATRARTLTLRYRACAAAVVQPLPAPSTFTG